MGPRWRRAAGRDAAQLQRRGEIGPRKAAVSGAWFGFADTGQTGPLEDMLGDRVPAEAQRR